MEESMKKMLLVTSIGLLLISNLFAARLSKDQKRLFQIAQRYGEQPINLLWDDSDEDEYYEENIEEKQYKEAVKLIKKGVNVDIKDKLGNTPLHYALKLEIIDSYKGLNIIKLLVENTNDINIKNNDHQTPLEKLLSEIKNTKGNKKIIKAEIKNRKLDINPWSTNVVNVIMYLLNKGAKLKNMKMYLKPPLKIGKSEYLPTIELAAKKSESSTTLFMYTSLMANKLYKTIRQLYKNEKIYDLRGHLLLIFSGTICDIIMAYEKFKNIKVYKKPSLKKQDFEERVEFVIKTKL